jgi:DUF4097 and DUF4098 domain-containing protein YvlB
LSQEIIERTLSVEGSPSLHLSNIRGSVNIQPGDEGVITISAVKHTDSGNSKKTLIEIDQKNEQQVTIKTHFDEKAWGLFGNGKPCKVDYSLLVPHSSSLKLNCVSSAASITDLEGEFSLNTVSGGFNLSKLSGPVTVHSVSGNINAENLKGPLRVEMVSGRVRANDCRFAETNCQTVSGHISLETPLNEERYRFKSVSGHITLIVPEDANVTATLKSMSGRLETSLPTTHSSRKRGIWHTKLGADGGSEVRAESISGNMVIVTSEEEITNAKAVTTSESGNSNDSANDFGKAMHVLERIENGELTVNEALEELRS